MLCYRYGYMHLSYFIPIHSNKINWFYKLYGFKLINMWELNTLISNTSWEANGTPLWERINVGDRRGILLLEKKSNICSKLSTHTHTPPPKKSHPLLKLLNVLLIISRHHKFKICFYYNFYSYHKLTLKLLYV